MWINNIIELKKKINNDKIIQAFELIQSTFTDYVLKIQDFKNEYSDNEKRYKQMTNRMPESFELIAKASSTAVPNNKDVIQYIEEKKNELLSLI